MAGTEKTNEESESDLLSKDRTIAIPNVLL